MKKRRITALIITLCMTLPLLFTGLVVTSAEESGIIRSGGWLESAFVEWTGVDGADGYNVYVTEADSTVWTAIDSMLIRSYGAYLRADAVGLKAGVYRMKIVPVFSYGESESAALVTDEVTVKAHDRSGFAFVSGTSSGAYNEDGTLKSNARVVYVTDENKDTVSLDIAIDNSGAQPIVGIQNILTALKKGYEKNPVCIRFIGNVTDPSTLDKGDLLVDFGKGKFTAGMTVEGIGEDTVFNGFGIRIKGVSNLEIRNIAFMNCDSNEGDSVSLQQDNNHIWVHNCDIFYGMAGSDADQDKGDGALDTKKSTYVTHSYNHFFDAGKSCLLGNTGETEENYITYHHNWFDHSDSRHPRVRTASVHVYNNFYDGISKYGIGATMGASIFSEANYFLNTKNPMLSSMQGTDVAKGVGTFSGEDGGIIKSFGNVFVNSTKVVDYSENSTDFDVYTVSDRNATVPSTVTAKQGGADYNNFDTSAIMYSYTPESAEDAMTSVKAYAGRMMGGDFKWTFAAGSQSSYAVDPSLKAALVGYVGRIVSIGSNANSDSDVTNPEGGNTNPDGGDTAPDGKDQVPDSANTHSFTENGKNDPEGFFSISGNTSTSKGSVSYDGHTFSTCLKIETSTNISFETAGKGTLVLVFGGTTNAVGKSIKIDGEKQIIPDTQVLEIELESGVHTVTKGDSINLFFMAYIPATPSEPNVPEHQHSYEFAVTPPTCTEAGYTTFTCACGDTYTGEETAAAGHKYSKEVIEPTCTEAGYTVFTCHCGDAYTDSETAPKGHSYTDGKCLSCGNTDPDYKPEPPHEHSFINGKCDCGEADPDYQPEAPDDNTSSGDTDKGDDTEEPEPEKLGFFKRIWLAILNFFKGIFSKKK